MPKGPLGIPPPPPLLEIKEEVCVPPLEEEEEEMPMPPPLIEKEVNSLEKGEEHVANMEKDTQEEVQEEDNVSRPTQVSSPNIMTPMVTFAPIIELITTREGTTSSSLGRDLVFTTMTSPRHDVSSDGVAPIWLSRALTRWRGHMQSEVEGMSMLTQVVTTNVVTMEDP